MAARSGRSVEAWGGEGEEWGAADVNLSAALIVASEGEGYEEGGGVDERLDKGNRESADVEFEVSEGGELLRLGEDSSEVKAQG